MRAMIAMSAATTAFPLRRFPSRARLTRNGIHRAGAKVSPSLAVATVEAF